MGPPIGRGKPAPRAELRAGPGRAAHRPHFRRLGYAGDELRALGSHPQDRRELRPGGYRLHRQADHRWRHGAGRPRHRQAARTSISSPMSRQSGSSDLKAGSITVERRAEGGVQVLRRSCPASSPCWRAPTRCAAAPSSEALNAARAEIVTWNAAAAGIGRHRQMRAEGLAYRSQARVRAEATLGKSLPDRPLGPWAGRNRRERHGRNLQAPAIA